MNTDVTPSPFGKAGPWAGEVNWWLMLLGPLAVAGGILYSVLFPKEFFDLQNTLEVPAPFLVGLACLVYLIRSLRTRNELHVLMAGLALAFTLREIHFGWTHRGIYVLLAAFGAAALLLRKRLLALPKDWRHISWLLATFAAYLLAFLIGRRAFKAIPGEHPIHRSIEEWAETAAHLLLIVTSFVGTWRRPPVPPKQDVAAQARLKT